MQSDKTLTTPIQFVLTIQRTESFINGTMLRSMRRNSKINQPFLNQEISKVIKRNFRSF